MSALPSIAPRLVVSAEDVEGVLVELSEEHAALAVELELLTLQLDAVSSSAPAGGWAVDEALVRAATASFERHCALWQASALAETEVAVAAAERAGAERIAGAQAEVADLLNMVRTEVGDRLVNEVEPTPAPPRPARLTPPPQLTEPSPGPVCAAQVAVGAGFADDDQDGPLWHDQEAASERFRAFWSEQDEGASIREALMAPLAAIAPMVFALLVIVLLLMLFV